MAQALSIASGVAGLFSGLSGNKKARATAGQGAAAQQFSLERLQQLYAAMMGLAGGRGKHAFDVDRQYAQVDAADRKAEHIESRKGVSALAGAGYKPGDSVFSRVTSGIGKQHKEWRDQARGDIERRNVLAQSQLYAMPAQVLGQISGAGNNLYNQGMSQIQNPSNLLSSGFLEQLGGLFGKKSGAPTSLDNRKYGNYA